MLRRYCCLSWIACLLGFASYIAVEGQNCPTSGQAPPAQPDPGSSLCDNYGQNYADTGSLSNAIANNSTLGARPCDINAACADLASSSARPRALSACLVSKATGLTRSFAGTAQELCSLLTDDPSLGVRCSGGTCGSPQQCINSCTENIPWRGTGGDLFSGRLSSVQGGSLQSGPPIARPPLVLASVPTFG